MNKNKFTLHRCVLPATLLLLMALGLNGCESSGNDNEFIRFFFAGGWLVWAVLLPLSLITSQQIVQNFLTIRKDILLPPALLKRLKTPAGHPGETNHRQRTLKILEQNDSVLSRTLHVALSQNGDDPAVMENALAEKIEQESSSLLRKIEWLNIIGNVAPMVGLFGTVWGMINAFNRILETAGQPDPADLAGGISTALLTTWWGMLVAIPALTAHGLLRNRIDHLADSIATEGEAVIKKIHKQTPTHQS
ncbi:MAG: MotA/TolQ/ExbB proton channel family protein [Planctomycetes bacterium]|nr:MotA/TolQ/ExbB proton channel family protein [Planctomycetota bacterium]